MEKNRVLGELLYTGFLCEKMRSAKRRKRKKQSLEHIKILREILLCMMEGEQSGRDAEVLQELWKFVCENQYFWERYRFTTDVKNEFASNNFALITSVDESFLQENVNELMLCMLDEVIENLSKFFVDRNHVWHLLHALHNLPRVYLTQNLPTLCQRGEVRINPETALQYAQSSMDDSMIEKYKRFFT